MTYTPTEQANIDAVTQMNAATNRGDFDATYSHVTPNCVTHMGETMLRGQAEHRDYDERFFPLFSRSARTILDIAADGDAVVFRWRVDATLAADGRAVSWDGVSWCRMEDAKVTESRIYVDSAAVQRQMRPPKEA